MPSLWGVLRKQENQAEEPAEPPPRRGRRPRARAPALAAVAEEDPAGGAAPTPAEVGHAGIEREGSPQEAPQLRTTRVTRSRAGRPPLPPGRGARAMQCSAEDTRAEDQAKGAGAGAALPSVCFMAELQSGVLLYSCLGQSASVSNIRLTSCHIPNHSFKAVRGAIPQDSHLRTTCLLMVV